jgi:hypothetical protein
MIAVAVLVALSACGGAAEENAAANQSGAEMLDGQAELAEDPNLANEAAADEAADIENYGGSAAAIDSNAQ